MPPPQVASHTIAPTAGERGAPAAEAEREVRDERGGPERQRAVWTTSPTASDSPWLARPRTAKTATTRIEPDRRHVLPPLRGRSCELAECGEQQVQQLGVAVDHLLQSGSCDRPA